jgi:hypothetical protein
MTASLGWSSLFRVHFRDVGETFQPDVRLEWLTYS